MLILRIVAAALAVVLVAVLFVDASGRRGPEPVLMYEKGVYLGQPDTEPSDETRAMIRARTNAQKAN